MMTKTMVNIRDNKYMDYLNPKPDDIDLKDIAHGLSQMCRYTSRTSHFWSVAQHSLLVASLMDKPEDKIHALLHDAPEAYIGDINSVLKNIIQEKFDIKSLEKNILACIYSKLNIGLPDADTYKRVKDADIVALMVEGTSLINLKAVDEWNIPVDKEKIMDLVHSNIVSKSSVSCWSIEKKYYDAVIKGINK